MNSESINGLDLHKDILKFVTTSTHLLFIQDVSVWNSFHDNPINHEKYADLSPRTLYEIFLGELLPNIFEHVQSDEERRKLELLDLNPAFKRSCNGYLPLSKSEASDIHFPVKRKIDFNLNKPPTTPQQLPRADEDALNLPFTLSTSSQANANEHSHTVLLEKNSSYAGTRSQFQFSPENAALLSAVFSNDHELYASKLLDPQTIHRHLRSAKQEFEAKGTMGLFRHNTDKLLSDIVRIKKIKEAYINLLSQRYFSAND